MRKHGRFDECGAEIRSGTSSGNNMCSLVHGLLDVCEYLARMCLADETSHIDIPRVRPTQPEPGRLPDHVLGEIIIDGLFHVYSFDSNTSLTAVCKCACY